MNKYNRLCMICIVQMIFTSACGYLNKSIDTRSVPITEADLGRIKGLMFNTDVLNHGSPSIGELCSDNYYFTREQWRQLNEQTGSSYLWYPISFGRWMNEYDQVSYANFALEGLARIKRNPFNATQWDETKGRAHFYRATAFFNIAQLISLPYDSITAYNDPGIPLKLTTDTSTRHNRGTVQQTYNQIISDLNSSLADLPLIPVANITPSVRAAHGMLARVFLSMRRYDPALYHADQALQMNDHLLDFSAMNPNSIWPMPDPLSNKEIAFLSYMESTGIIAPPIQSTDPALYQSYDPADLRRTMFFTIGREGEVLFRGSYAKSTTCFSGIANDELFLIRAECHARAGRTDKAMDALNTLLVKRYLKGRFKPLSAQSAEDALQQILTERRKELVHRGLRWTDLRRLNKDPQTAITLQRKIGGKIFTLPPVDDRWVFLLPLNEINVSYMQQNPRDNIYLDIEANQSL
ncbi:RagB/SusD family nutrient uptake outer membrane protein [Pseudoflavitalea sp. X16]|uniref:RagB/SusD family nutrient uptake outer membrane protein n=1 Tax=Paraflavitalea devenefica TaxID=2716334 RepID=UPI0014200E74|nr:RagB/SusD family nutrient uptake outer membrane protein [Paraflavitalea devenefica]NII26219.1 RagB/SusD family nutrient uptake outer membrane protein [Paraflavitalea devenefica]